MFISRQRLAADFASALLKKRTTDFEKTVRKLELTHYGIKVGRAMPHIQGILGGILRAEGL